MKITPKAEVMTERNLKKNSEREVETPGSKLWPEMQSRQKSSHPAEPELGKELGAA